MVVKPIEAIVRYSPGEWQAAVVGIVLYEGKVLLGKKTGESTGSFSGLWHIPAEKLEPGESYVEALVRGMYEEAGVEVSVGREIARGYTPKGRLLRWYECEALSDKISPSSELTEVRWVTKEDVANEDYVNSESRKLWPKELHEYFRKL